MKWFRMYHEARTDAKLESLTDEQFRVWFKLICFANEQPTRGEVIVKSKRLLSVEVAKSNVELLNETLTILSELNVISFDNDTIAFLNWDKRQFKSDGATERWHEWNEKKKTNVGQTFDKQSSNVEQTIDQHVTDTDTDTDLKEKRKSIVTQMLAQLFPRGLSERNRYDITEYMDELQDLELLNIAYRIAVEKDATQKDSYIKSILRGFLNDGITTIAQYEARESQRQIATGGETNAARSGYRKEIHVVGTRARSITGGRVGKV